MKRRYTGLLFLKVGEHTHTYILICIYCLKCSRVKWAGAAATRVAYVVPVHTQDLTHAPVPSYSLYL